MSFQPLFRRFHEAIQLKRFKENKELVEKRDIILKRIREKIAVPHTFEPFNQGSYEMGTGVKPLNGDYDIDVGLLFNVHWQDHDPATVKGWVHAAVYGHTDDVQWRRPCITVYYRRSGETIYHVDLAVLAKDRSCGQLRLAIGKQNASKDQQEWQADDRKGFMQAVESRFTGEDAAQFVRVIRYLKRWKDKHFPSEGRAAPTGLSLTVAAHRWFQPTKSGGYGSTDHDDLGATLSLSRSILQSFAQTWDSQLGRHTRGLSLQFPNAPRDNVFERMTNQQMQEFYQRLEQLIGWLEEAQRTGTVAPLRRAFGDEFPEK